MIRCAEYAVIAAVVLFPSGGTAMERYWDPVSRVSFERPPGSKERALGFGNEIAAFHTRDGARIRVIWRAGAFGPQKGAQQEQDGTARFFQLVEGGAVEVQCRATAQKFLNIFFECRRLVQGIRREPVVEARSSLLDDANRIQGEARYALLDGRSGCPDAGLRPRSFAAVMRQRGEGTGARALESLADKLDRKENTAASLDEERRRDSFFARLALARYHLEQGDPERAKKILSSDTGVSRLAAALRMWAARQNGDVGAVRSMAEEFDGEFCGEGGALAAHELGEAIRDEEPDRALSLFETAIAADRALVPAYVSWARLSLDRGRGTEEVKRRLLALLARAPATEGVEHLRRDLKSLRRDP